MVARFFTKHVIYKTYFKSGLITRFLLYSLIIIYSIDSHTEKICIYIVNRCSTILFFVLPLFPFVIVNENREGKR